MIKEFKQLVLPKYKEDYTFRKLIVVAYLQSKEELARVEQNIAEFTEIKKPTGIAKALNTSSYKAYTEKTQELEKLNIQKADLEKKVAEYKTVYDQVYPDYVKYEKLIEDINNLEKPEIFRQYYQMMVQMLKSNNIPVVLTEEEQQYAIRFQSFSDKELKSMDDIVLVHKTSNKVYYDTITTPFLSYDLTVIPCTIAGESYLIDTRRSEDTTHFSANSPKGTHEEKNKPTVAVITNIKNVKKSRILGNLQDDLFMEGNLELTSDAIILCPREYYDEMSKSNKNACVIAYEGNLDESITTILTLLDYPIIDLESKKISEVNNGKNYYTILAENGYTNTERFSDSVLKKAEDFQMVLNKIFGLIELIKNTPELWEIDPQIIVNETSFLKDIKTVTSLSQFNFAAKLASVGIEVGMEDMDLNNIIEEEYAKVIIKKAQDIGRQLGPKHTR